MKVAIHILSIITFLAYPSESFFLGHSKIRHVESSFIKTKTSLNSQAAPQQDLYYAAAGSPKVDMNKYNLLLDESVSQWTALITPKSVMTDEGIYLNAKNSKEYFVDTLRFSIKREGGLGLLLTELAGGREDGVGITIVEEVLKGKNSECSGIIPGDSIVAVTVRQSNTKLKTGFETSEDVYSVSTECLGYDATVDVLTSLPPPTKSDEEITVTVKRLRKKPRVTVNLQFPPDQNEPDVTIELFSGENLRRAMLTRGVKLNDALARRFDSGGTGDCGADGTCATCVVGITKGMELVNPINTQEQQILSKHPRWRMACKTVVGHGMQEGDMTIQVNPRQWL